MELMLKTMEFIKVNFQLVIFLTSIIIGAFASKSQNKK